MFDGNNGDMVEKHWSNSLREFSHACKHATTVIQMYLINKNQVI